MNVETVLEQLGYEPNEIKIYLAALQLGEVNVTDLANKAGLPRTTVRGSIEQMQKKGLLNHFEKHGHIYLVAVEPERLLSYEREKEAELSSIIKDLTAIRRKSLTQKPSVLSFYGVSEVKLIFEDMIETRHPIFAVDSWEDVQEVLGKDFMKGFIKRRSEHFLKIKLIVERTAASLELKRRDSAELRHTRFLPSNFQLHRTSNFIYGDKIALISLNRKEPVGVVIVDPDMSHTMTVYFENLWSQSTD